MTRPEYLHTADDIILKKFAPAGAIVNSQHEILQFRGNSGQYFNFPAGQASLQLFNLLKSELIPEVRKPFLKVQETGVPHHVGNVRLTGQEKVHTLTIEVIPIRADEITNYLLIFQEQHTPARLEPHPPQERKPSSPQLILDRQLSDLYRKLDVLIHENEEANAGINDAVRKLQKLRLQMAENLAALDDAKAEFYSLNDRLNNRSGELEKTQLFAAAIFKNLSQPVALLDRKAGIQFANEAFIDSFGLHGEIIEGKCLYDTAGGILRALQQPLDDLADLNKPVSHLEIHKPEENAIRTLLVTATLIRDEDQAYFLLIFDDVTALRIVEQKFTDSQLQFSSIADILPQLIWTADQEGMFTYYNKAFYTFTGLTFEELQRSGWTGLLAEEDREVHAKLWEHSLKTGKEFCIEHRMLDMNGTPHWHITRAQPQRGANEQIIQWVGTSTDIHEQKICEEELEKQVRDTTRTLHDTSKQLENSTQELEQFSFVSSHDLQEPLRKIRTFSALLSERYKDNLPADARKYLNKISSSSARLVKLIDDLHSYSLLSREKTFVQVDLNAVLKGVLEDFELQITSKSAEITIDRLPVIEAIPIQMNQLFYNLISNALKFCHEGVPPVIRISVEFLTRKQMRQYPKLNKDLSYWKIVFEDKGIGFKQEYSDKVFEIFQRLDCHEKYNGTGIGLAICKSIMNAHNGDIRVTSEENKGCTFNIIIPMSQSPVS